VAYYMWWASLLASLLQLLGILLHWVFFWAVPIFAGQVL
jgi:hypothetical protein